MELPSYEPQVPIFTPWQVIEPKFKYRLASDELTWYNWANAVANQAEYVVSPIDLYNAEKFSPFILQTECITGSQYDGCCMISEYSGALCTFRGQSDTEMDTYRFEYEEWYNVEQIYRTGQLDYIGAYTGKVEINGNPPNAKLWMDKLNCEAQDPNDFICTGWQPAWRTAFAYDQGYPRFGRWEEGIKAGTIDVTRDREARFLQIELMSAVSLAVGAATVTLMTLF